MTGALSFDAAASPLPILSSIPSHEVVFHVSLDHSGGSSIHSADQWHYAREALGGNEEIPEDVAVVDGYGRSRVATARRWTPGGYRVACTISLPEENPLSRAISLTEARRRYLDPRRR